MNAVTKQVVTNLFSWKDGSVSYCKQTCVVNVKYENDMDKRHSNKLKIVDDVTRCNKRQCSSALDFSCDIVTVSETLLLTSDIYL